MGRVGGFSVGTPYGVTVMCVGDPQQYISVVTRISIRSSPVQGHSLHLLTKVSRFETVVPNRVYLLFYEIWTVHDLQLRVFEVK